MPEDRLSASRCFGTVIDVNSPPIANQHSNNKPVQSDKQSMSIVDLFDHKSYSNMNNNEKRAINVKKMKIGKKCNHFRENLKRKHDLSENDLIDCYRKKSKTKSKSDLKKIKCQDVSLSLSDNSTQTVDVDKVVQIKWLTEPEVDTDYHKVLIRERLVALKEVYLENELLEKQIKQLRKDSDELEQMYDELMEIDQLLFS